MRLNPLSGTNYHLRKDNALKRLKIIIMKTEEELLIEAQEWAKKEKEDRLFGQQVNIARHTDDFQTEAYIAGYEACRNEIMAQYILTLK